ncbi:MAG TPA: hypothetical protein VIG39_02060 [Rhizomicrobium sp.]
MPVSPSARKAAIGLLLFLAAPAMAATYKHSDVPYQGPRVPIPMTPERQAMLDATQKEYEREQAVLGISGKLREITDSHSPVDAPNAPNYDEAASAPYPYASDVLRLKDGKETKTAEEWWKLRRPQIVEAFDREIFGSAPKQTPKVTWSVVQTAGEDVGGHAAITRRLKGHADNSADPAITVDIDMTLTLPAPVKGQVKGKVPVIIQLGAINPRPFPAGALPFGIKPDKGPDWRAQVLALGWGYAILDPGSVQADNGAGLDKGIIGLVNKGRPRKMDDWGALRAWAWGASRAVDFLRSDPHVAADRIGIQGHSRYGKAAIVAMAYDPRIAIGFISSSGAGGAKLFHHYFGETLENVAAANEFHWMAGNFLKYAAGSMSVKDLPVDMDALVALCAPRPVFIGAGASAQGDAWVDARGMFMAAVGADPVYRLLGHKGLETTQFPPPLTPLLAGDLGFRQHEQGHTPGPNWPYFLTFAKQHLATRKAS